MFLIIIEVGLVIKTAAVKNTQNLSLNKSHSISGFLYKTAITNSIINVPALGVVATVSELRTFGKINFLRENQSSG